jgi:hypothetical protein
MSAFSVPRVAEIDEYAVAHVAGDEAFVVLHPVAAGVLERRDDLAQILRVELRGESGRADQIAEHDRELAPLGFPARRRGRGGWRFGNGGRVECAERFQHPQAIAEGDSELLQVLLGEVGQDIEADIVFGENVRVLTETMLLQPLCQFAHGFHRVL